MRDNLIIFPATKNYLPEARVLLKSLLVHMPTTPVHIMSKDFEAEGLKEFKNVEMVLNEQKCDSEFRQVRTTRFRHAADMQGQFKVVCLLDADSLAVYNFEHIFRMADTGTLLVCSNNTLFRYIKKDFDHMKVSAPDNIDCISCSFSTVPMFVNPNDALHQKFLREVIANATGNDLDVPNLLVHVLGLANKMYLLPSQNWTGIHHTNLKPEVGLKKVCDGFVSQLGERVYMFHGHHLDKEGYVKNLMEPMIKHYGWHQKYIDNAKQCINLIQEEYDKYRK
jgi:hypothetical protein